MISKHTFSIHATPNNRVQRDIEIVNINTRKAAMVEAYRMLQNINNAGQYTYDGIVLEYGPIGESAFLSRPSTNERKR